MSEYKIHPTCTVTNIRNYIPIILEMENGQYDSWVELFTIHCRAYMDIDHIIPKDTSSIASDTTSDTTPAITDSTDNWDRLDAIVLTWIYGTISKDNRHTHLVHLQHKFNNIKIDDFPNASAYCQELKSIVDQLSNVDPDIDDDRLVL
ncbi:uncharacterized protein [Rutidosis leptorrhynchoides]|uniref:uncharacterized protein n=1 Tax=Rutidosis leptorrhynchoides TaxID=125765 RepID=UPI003A990845